MRFLLDTNVVSELARAAPDPGVARWLAERDPFTLHISAVTFGEIGEGIARLPPGERRGRLEAWRRRLAEITEERVIPVDLAIATAWSALRGRLFGEGRPMAPLDAFIAATAEVHDLTVATRNTHHFAAWGGPVIDPWEVAG